MNRIQNLRKTSGLEITDRITIEIERRDEIAAAVEHCREYIASQVLATSLALVDKVAEPQVLDMDGYTVNITIKKA